MSTDALLYPGLTLTLGVDGYRAAAELASDGCCSDTLCITEREAACSYLDLLPSGPLWDREKLEIRDAIVANNGVPATGFGHASMVVYGVYLGQVYENMVTKILQPTVREAFPHTAVDTLDDWLNRYDWVDCYRSACRSNYLGGFSPYEADGTCGPAYFATDFSTEFECALKHAILQSLDRAKNGIIKNIDGINWVIAPLGARISASISPVVQDFLDGTCVPEEGEGPPCFCEDVALEICNVGTTLPGCPTADSFCAEEPVATVAAEQTYSRPGLVDIQVFPAVIAAECIVKSFLGRVCPNIVNRCADVVNPPVAAAATPIANIILAGDDPAAPAALVYEPAGDPVGYLLGRTSYNNGVGGSTKGAIFTANNRRFLTGVNFSVPVGPNMFVFVAELDAAGNITSILLDSPEVVGYTSGSHHYTLPAPILLEPGTRFMVSAYRSDDATLTHRHGPNDADPNGHFTPDPTSRIDGNAADRVVGGSLVSPHIAGRPFGIHLTSETANLVP